MALDGLAVEPHQLKLQYLLLALTLFPILIFSVRYLFRVLWPTPRQVPGPFLARASRLWYLFHVLRGDWHRVVLLQHRRYGPIVRIAPNYYSIDDPHAIKTLYGAGTNFVKGPWYSVAGDPTMKIRDVFTDLDPKSHAAHRRQVASLYAVSSLVKMEPNVDECIQELGARFSEIVRSGKIINLQWWLQCYAFDVIGCISFGSRFGFLDKGEDPLGLISALHASLKYVARVGVYPEWHSCLFRIMQHLGKGPLDRTIAFADEIIQERKRAIEKKGVDRQNDDFLSKVLKLHRQDPVAFPEEKVFLTCFQNVGAGSDTTSISLSGIMWHLLTNTGPLEKLRAEIDQKTAKGELSDLPSFSETQAMPYLQASIQEGLRMHPAAAFPLVRVVPKGGAVVAGTYFPEGTHVAANCWVAHYNQDVFGEDADQFRPERWLGDPEQVLRMGRYWIPFGHGAATCLGKNISLMEIAKVIPYILRKYDFKAVGTQYNKLECDYVCFVKPKNFTVQISGRN